MKTDESQNIVYKNTQFYEEVGNVLKRSESHPYFYVCQSDNRSAVVDILQPHSPLDIRLMIEASKPYSWFSLIREYNDKEMAAMLVYLTIDANEKSFVNGTPTWRR
jgi:hypothetical protein